MVGLILNNKVDILLIKLLIGTKETHNKNIKNM